MWSDNSGTAPKDWNKQYMYIKHRMNMYYGVGLLFLVKLQGQKGKTCHRHRGIRVVSPRKVSRFAPLNRYYIIIDEVFFDNFWVIIYLLVVCKKKNNSFISVYFNYLFISCIQKIIIIHSFWFTFVKDLKRNFSFKIYKKPHKNSKKLFFLYQRKGA